MFVSDKIKLAILAMILLPIFISASQTKFSCEKLIIVDSLLSKSDADIETNINNDRWISVDKGYHLIGSLISTIGITNSCMQFADIRKDKSMQIGVSCTFTLGVGKELWDSRKKNNFFSWKDLSADVLGILIGIFLMQID